GGSDSSTDTSTPPQATTATARQASAQVSSFEKETQQFRPAMEGYFQDHYCSEVSNAKCECEIKRLNKDYVSAREFHDYLVRLIKNVPDAKTTLYAVMGKCNGAGSS